MRQESYHFLKNTLIIVLQEGDTLSQIAKDCNTRYGTNYTADDLQGLNSDTISDKDKIYAGNYLNLGKTEDVQKKSY